MASPTAPTPAAVGFEIMLAINEKIPSNPIAWVSQRNSSMVSNNGNSFFIILIMSIFSTTVELASLICFSIEALYSGL